MTDNGSEDKVLLLVEDDANDEALTLRALKRHNVKNAVVIARDGAEALDWLFCRGAFGGRDPDALPQVILLDLKLPKVSGLEVLQAVRGHPKTRRLPVVVLTSSKEDQDLIASYDSGANSYVGKPVSFEAFADAIQQLGLYWLVLNETAPAGRPGR
jgi:two-component system response regulator